MSQFERESLSALLDNEADELEIRRVLKSCEQDPALLDTWERFSLVQALLHEPATPVSSGLAQGVALQIEEEASWQLGDVTATTVSASWQQNFAKLAIAASVALVFILGVQTSLDDEAMPVAQQSSAEAGSETASALPQAASLLAEQSAVIELDPAAQQRLRDYIGSMAIDAEEPLRIAHIQDSPLFRLVNETVAKPPQ
jgi:sigma-E factor negative regulatory protein RseA